MMTSPIKEQHRDCSVGRHVSLTKIANESWIENVIPIIRVNLLILNRIRNVMKIDGQA